jgi:CSLREA domain-containing protein
VPATIVVTTLADVVNPTDGKVSLREAINLANVSTTPDTIILPVGVLRIGLAGAGENANATGDFDISNPLTILGQGSSATVIDGGRYDRIFEIIGSHGVSFANMTLRNGAGGQLNGGAIYAETGHIGMDHCAVVGNSAAHGGGIHAENGQVLVIGSVFAGNVASYNGGAMRLGTGTLAVRESVVRNNLAHIGGGIFAVNSTLLNTTVSGNSAHSTSGGIYTGQATLTNCIISGNSALQYGGIQGSTVMMSNSVVRGNVSRSSGGGLAVTRVTLINSTVNGNFSLSGFGGGIQANTVTLTNSTVNGNFALYGGGIYALDGSLTNSTVNGNFATQGGGIYAVTTTLTNSTVSGNHASEIGGGILATTATLTNCTITLNSSAEEGGGVYHDGTGTFRVKNTIIAQNLVGFNNSGVDVYGTFVSDGHNLIGEGTGSTGFGVNGDMVGTANNPLDPMLAPLAFNGGRTMTHALLAGNLAIDRGDNAVALTTDQRGLARRKDGDKNAVAVVDIGAFEL